MIRFAVVSYCVLYVVVSSLRQLAHGPPHTTAAKNRAGSPHSMYMYLLLVQHTILVNSLHAMLARTSLARKRSRASLEKKLPPSSSFNLLFGKRATLGRSCCCYCGRRRPPQQQQCTGLVLGQGLIKKRLQNESFTVTSRSNQIKTQQLSQALTYYY